MGCIAVILLVGLTGSVGAATPQPLDLTKIEPPSSENVNLCPDDSVGIGGRIYDGYVGTGYDGGFVIWRVPKGYTVFEAWVGIDDEYRAEKPGIFRLSIDGDLVKTSEIRYGEKAEHWSIPVGSGKSIRVEMDTTSSGLMIAQPRLLAQASTSDTTSASSQVATTPDGSAAPFVVDPNDLEKLAVALKKRVDSKPEVKARIDKGQVALMTFTLLDIPSQTVAANVAEDLYTSMINNDFPLVERGQLDKVLKELKIQDTALIDPTTAQKIGKLSGCDLILLGSISDRGQFVVINSRLMETATGKALVAERVEMRKIPISH